MIKVVLGCGRFSNNNGIDDNDTRIDGGNDTGDDDGDGDENDDKIVMIMMTMMIMIMTMIMMKTFTGGSRGSGGLDFRAQPLQWPL